MESWQLSLVGSEGTKVYGMACVASLQFQLCNLWGKHQDAKEGRVHTRTVGNREALHFVMIPASAFVLKNNNTSPCVCYCKQPWERGYGLAEGGKKRL